MGADVEDHDLAKVCDRTVLLGNTAESGYATRRVMEVPKRAVDRWERILDALDDRR
jgi:hypothetical protein